MQRIYKKWIPVFLAPSIIMYCFLYAMPFFTIVVTSFTKYKLTQKDITFIGFTNYINLFTKDITFKIALKNTAVWMILHVFLHVAIGIFMALILYRKPRGWKFVRTVYMIPNIIASSAIGLIFLQLYNAEYGLVNQILKSLGLENLTRNWLFDTNTAFWSVTMIWFPFAGYTCTLVLARLLSISEEMFEAAKVEGANVLQIDWYISLPLAKDTIAATMIMAASYMLTMFPLIYVTTGGGPGVTTTNLPLYLYKVAMLENDYGYANTIGIFIIIVGIVIMQIINRVMKVNEEV
ncbi:MAG TPA: sugar ABC transporter permease [Clostridiaceae bacterium]|nr:sugar ABC transporter permease [Clostridiaceae bacterium]